MQRRSENTVPTGTQKFHIVFPNFVFPAPIDYSVAANLRNTLCTSGKKAFVWASNEKRVGCWERGVSNVSVGHWCPGIWSRLDVLIDSRARCTTITVPSSCFGEISKVREKRMRIFFCGRACGFCYSATNALEPAR